MYSDIEQKYRALFEQSPYGILVIDMEGRFLDFNETAHRDLGYSREEFSRLTIADIDPDESPADIKARISRILKEGAAEFDVRHRTKQGEIRDVHVIIKALALSGRTLFHTIWRDITESKRTADALRISEERLRQSVRVSQLGIFEHDHLAGTVYWSPRQREIYGWGPDETVTLEGFIDCIYPEDRERIAAAVRQAHDPEGDGLFEVEHRIIHRNGSVRWVTTRSQTFFSGEGGARRAVQTIGAVRDVTESKTTADRLKKSESQLSASQAVARLGNWDLNLVSQELEWSDETYLLFDKRPQDFVPTFDAFAKMVHPDDLETMQTNFENALRSDDAPYHAVLRIINDSGRQWVLEAFGVVSRDDTGKAISIFGTAQDITESKAAENKIRQSERRFHALFDHAPLGIVIVGPDRAILDCNVAFQKMLGYSLEELKALTVPDVSYAEDDLATRVHYKDMLEGKIKSFTMEKRHIRKDGSILWTNLTGSMVRDGKSAPQFVFGIVEDISGRKKMEEDLRRSRDFIERILDTVDEAFIVIDRNYRILMANSAYGKQVGSPVHQLIGRHCYEISHQSAVPCYEAGEECSVRHCFETGIPGSCFHKHASRDGSVLYVETKAFPLKDSTGAVTSVIETVSNITDKHLLEEEQLKTQKLEAIGILAGGIAHDFNNLLQGVFGYISMAKLMHDEKQKSLDMLDQAEKALHMSVNLTSQLLTFSKGGKPLKTQIALRPVIENSAKFALSGSRVDCRLDFDRELWTVEADEGQIAQVIQNLVLNADQAMPVGGIITIKARNVNSPGNGLPPALKKGDYVELSIRDSGIGIPEQYLPKIFDPYFTTKDKGSGLGLATCYSIIKNHGGFIDVQSKSGEGTTFLVYLPALEAVEAAAATVSEDVKAVRKGRILLMDDEEIVRHVAGFMIDSLGHEVEVAEDGTEAIAKYMESMKGGRKFDIVIMDLTVRGQMGGEEAIKELLRIDPDIKAVVSSGYTDSAAVSDYKSLGFRACLSKPYDIDSLNKTINSLIL